MNHLRSQLKKIRTAPGLINPDANWVRANKARLLQQIKNTVVHRDTFSFSTRLRETLYAIQGVAFLRNLKPVFTALLVALLATGGWIASVSASFNSLPGDTLWSVKRAAQRTEIAVKSFGASDEEKTQLHLAFAKNRVEEIKRTIAEHPVTSSDGQSKQSQDLTTAVQDVQEAVKTATNVANEQLKTVAKDNPQEALALVQDVTKNTNQIAASLSATARQPNAVDAQVAKQVIETVKVLNDSSLSTVETVVAQGQSGASPAVKSLVSDKLSELAATAEGIKQQLNQITTSSLFINASSTAATTGTLGVNPSLITSSSFKEILGTTTMLTNSPSTTPAFGNTPTTSVQLLKAAQEKTAALQESVGEIKKIIDTGNLQEAVNKLKGSNETAGSAQQLIVDTKTTAAVKTP